MPVTASDSVVGITPAGGSEGEAAGDGAAGEGAAGEGATDDAAAGAGGKLGEASDAGDSDAETGGAGEGIDCATAIRPKATSAIEASTKNSGLINLPQVATACVTTVLET